MTRASPQTRSLARQLSAFETSVGTPAGSDHTRAFPAVEKLRLDLVALMGPIGCRALIARAMKFAVAERGWLAGIQVGDNGELEGLDGAVQAAGPADAADGEVALLSQLIGLLVAFIGATLTLRLIKQIWPQLVFDIVDFSATPTHEED